MPALPPDPLLVPALFVHTYDIDQIIEALCTPLPDGKPWHLNTRDGVLTPEAPDAVPAVFIFMLEPLPPALMPQIVEHPLFGRLTPEDAAVVRGWVRDRVTLHALMPEFAVSMAGGWVRERVKELALEWLNRHGLIPPSMRHVHALATPMTALTYPQKVKIG